MPVSSYVGIIVILVIIIYFIINYNRMIRIDNACEEAWCNVDTELKRRHDLIPNLVKVVKAYAGHERGIIESVTKYRELAFQSRGTLVEREESERLLNASIGKLMIRLENYPDLKANQNFLELQIRLTHTEDRIQAAFRLYNGNVRELENVIEMIPTCFIARFCGFGKRQYFKISPEDESQSIKNVPVVNLQR